MSAIAARAAAAFPAWAATGPNARRAVLMKAAAALEARAGRLRRGRLADERDWRDQGMGAVQPWPCCQQWCARPPRSRLRFQARSFHPTSRAAWRMALKRAWSASFSALPRGTHRSSCGVRAIAVPLACGNAVDPQAPAKPVRARMRSSSRPLPKLVFPKVRSTSSPTRPRMRLRLSARSSTRRRSSASTSPDRRPSVASSRNAPQSI